MKMKTYITVCYATFALSCGIARAQDSSRVPDSNPDAGAAVDATVHADVNEQAAQPLAQRRQPNKRQQAGSTRWASQSANQPSATRFHPDQATGLLSAQPGTGDTPSTLFNPLTRSDIPPSDILHHGQDTPFRIAPIAGTTEPPDPHFAAIRAMLQNLSSQNETSTQDVKTRDLLRSPYPRNNSFSTPVREKKIQPTENTLFPGPFLKLGGSNSTPLKAKPQKRNPPNSVGGGKPASSIGSELTKQN